MRFLRLTQLKMETTGSKFAQQHLRRCGRFATTANEQLGHLGALALMDTSQGALKSFPFVETPKTEEVMTPFLRNCRLWKEQRGISR
jgi:hypothetical protein